MDPDLPADEAIAASNQRHMEWHQIRRDSVCKLTLDRLTTGAFARYRDERLQSVGSQQVRHDLNAFAIVLRAARLDWDVPLSTIPLDAVRKPKIPPGRDRRLLDGEYEALREAAMAGESLVQYGSTVRYAVRYSSFEVPVLQSGRGWGATTERMRQ